MIPFLTSINFFKDLIFKKILFLIRSHLKKLQFWYDFIFDEILFIFDKIAIFDFSFDKIFHLIRFPIW